MAVGFAPKYLKGDHAGVFLVDLAEPATLKPRELQATAYGFRANTRTGEVLGSWYVKLTDD